MRLDRQLVHMLVATIALIVAHLVPSAAEAHAGHHHPRPAAVAADASSAKAQPSAMASARSAMASARAEAIQAVVIGRGTLPTPRGCNGVCCSLGMACCVHALAAETGGVIPARTAARLARVPDLLARPGVDPEALPKPPRTIA